MNSISGLMENDVFVIGLYGALPKFENINIHQINLNWNGPCANVIFDLRDFPNSPPRKWRGFNTVQLEISLFPLVEVRIEKFSSGNVCNVCIEKKGALFCFEVTGASEAIFVAPSVRINNVSAYLNLP